MLLTFDGQMAAWAARLRNARAREDAQRAEQDLRQKTVAVPPGRGGSLAAVWEATGAKPVDGPTVTVTDVATAVKRLERADKGRTLMAAIQAVEDAWKSDGKPHRFMVD